METELLLAKNEGQNDESVKKADCCVTLPPNETKSELTTNDQNGCCSSSTIKQLQKNLYEISSKQSLKNGLLQCKSLEQLDQELPNNHQIHLRDKYLSRSSNYVSEIKDISVEISTTTKCGKQNSQHSSPNTRIISTSRYHFQF